MQGQGDGSAAGQGIPSKKGSAGDYSRKQDLAQVAEIQAWDQTPLREQALPRRVQEATDPHSRSFSKKKNGSVGGGMPRHNGYPFVLPYSFTCLS
jgi:hypothetical protein